MTSGQDADSAISMMPGARIEPSDLEEAWTDYMVSGSLQMRDTARVMAADLYLMDSVDGKLAKQLVLPLGINVTSYKMGSTSCQAA